MIFPLLPFVAVARCVFSRGRADEGMVFAVWAALAVHAADLFLVFLCVLVTAATYIDGRTIAPLALGVGAINSAKHYAQDAPRDGDLFFVGTTVVCLPAVIAATRALYDKYQQ